ncbi:right-handed parallel beta-helix repeat-containing protein [Flavihumibacter fluvii]|uniref:right-handed parallel beta-helix repeat-containing protein n=1 Tax=Flavihumibacter fluvii TaxID=2838157 RepID=UPI001BDED73D|nr:right-handed parallel beta-helix repeat-containing protein [Flavihumibacter fluvii]ULQ50929.1 right-handed parallel beta-helix repeat-containing protein [Flavihumibacter fluvii]
MNKLRLLTLFGLYLLPSFSNGGTIIVAPGSATYSTIQSGLDAANAGDTVLVKAGIYHETVTFNKSGKANHAITLIGEKGAIIEGTKNLRQGIVVNDKSYLEIIGLEIRHFKGSGVPIGISVRGSGTSIEIRNNTIHHIENSAGNAHGIAIYGTNKMVLSKIIVDGNEISDCQLGSSESLVLNGNVTQFVVSNNLIHDNDNIGIDFIGFESVGPEGFDQAYDGICFGNTVYNISSLKNPAYNGSQSADGIYVDGGRNIIIERNTVYNCDIGIELASEHLNRNTEDIIVRNNFVSGSFQANIMAGGYAADKGRAVNVAIINNSTYLGREGEVALQFNCNNITIRNNIFYGRPDQAYLQNRGSNNTLVTINCNIYYGQSSSSPGSWPDANAKYLDPMLVSPYSNMHLSAGSPAINSACAPGNDKQGKPLSGTLDIDNKNRTENGKLDIGADEYQTNW